MTHTFMPIIGEQNFQAGLEYICQKSQQLTEVVLASKLALDTICFFSQSRAEHLFIRNHVREFGQTSKFSHGPTFYVDCDLEIAGQKIKILGVREPDTTRPQVGYADFPVKNYDELLAGGYPEISEITSGRGQKLLEIRSSDFDVLGFLVKAEEHN